MVINTVMENNITTISKRWGHVQEVLDVQKLFKVIAEHQGRLEQEIESANGSGMQTKSEKETIKVMEYLGHCLEA